MSDLHFHNPIGRLYALVSHTRALGLRNAQNSPACPNAWAEYLNVDSTDRAAMYRMLARIVELPSTARDAVQAINTGGVPLDRFIAPVERCGETVLNAAASRLSAAQFSGRVNEADVALLEAASFMANHNAPADWAPTETLDRIRELLAEIRDLIVGDKSVDAELRTAVLLSTERLQRSIDLYKIGGMDAIADEIDKLVGFTARNHISTGKKPPATFMRRLFELAQVVAVASAAVAAPAQALDAMESYAELLSGSAAEEIVAPADESPPSA